MRPSFVLKFIHLVLIKYQEILDGQGKSLDDLACAFRFVR